MKHNLESYVLERSSVRLEDVAGLEEAKEVLKESVILPLKHPDLFEGRRTPHKGILLYGAAGVGKTFLIRSLANELSGEGTCYVVYAADLCSRQARVRLRDLLRMFRASGPCVVVIDDIDMIRVDSPSDDATAGGRQVLEALESKENDDTTVIGLTNKPWNLDPSIRRRFSRLSYLPLPGADARHRILRDHIAGVAPTIGDDECRSLSGRLAGFTGADISCLVRHAAMEPVRALHKATHFKRVTGVSPTQPCVVQDDLLTPCDPNDPDAIEMTWDKIADDKLLPVGMTSVDLWNSVDTVKPSITEDDLSKFSEFQYAAGD